MDPKFNEACADKVIAKQRKASFAAPPGYAAFRPVIIKCTECGCTKQTNGQMEAGRYEWKCDGCDRKTTHTVTEAA